MIVLEWLFLTISPCDAAEPWQLGFQDAATPMMQGIIDLHHDIFFFLILILVFVLWILVRTLWHFHYQLLHMDKKNVHVSSSSSDTPPSSSRANRNNKKESEITTYIVSELYKFIDKYRTNINEDFPGAKDYMETELFSTTFVTYMKEDFGLSPNVGAKVLREVKKCFEKDLGEIDEYRNNVLYSALKHLLKDFRRK